MDNGKKSIAGRLTFGMLIICIGITLLLNNIGYVSSSVWNDIISYWPVLLIIAGINVIFEHSAARPITYLSPLVVAGVFAFVIMNYEPSSEVASNNEQTNLFKSDTKHESSFSVTGYETKDVDSVNLEVNGGAGTIGVSEWEEYAQGEVVSVDAETTGFVPKLNEKLDDRVLKIELSDDDTSVFKNRGHDYKIKLSPEYIYNLIINTGAGDLSFDMSKNKVKNLQINSGAAEVTLVTPSVGSSDCEIEINSGAAEIEIEVPAGVKVRITKNGLAVIDADDLLESGGVYSNPNESGETPFSVNIEINNAVGAISLKPYEDSDSNNDSGKQNVSEDDAVDNQADGTSVDEDQTGSGKSTGANPNPAWYDLFSHV
jgi:hypothetical protein